MFPQESIFSIQEHNVSTRKYILYPGTQCFHKKGHSLSRNTMFPQESTSFPSEEFILNLSLLNIRQVASFTASYNNNTIRYSAFNKPHALNFVVLKPIKSDIYISYIQESSSYLADTSHFVCFARSRGFIKFMQRFLAYCENNTKHVTTLCLQGAETIWGKYTAK